MLFTTEPSLPSSQRTRHAAWLPVPVLCLSTFQFHIGLQSSAQSSFQSVTVGPEEWEWQPSSPSSPSTAPTAWVTWGTSSVRGSTAGRSTPAPVLSVGNSSSGTKPLRVHTTVNHALYDFYCSILLAEVSNLLIGGRRSEEVKLEYFFSFIYSFTSS